MGKVGAPEKLTDGMKSWIASIYSKNPKLKAPKVRDLLENKFRANLRKQLDEKYPKWTPEQKNNEIDKYIKKLPQKDRIRKYMKEIKPNLKKEFPLDKPWSAASMAKYPFPAEALPSLLQLWVWTRENQNFKFTIRHALWASRFYAAIKDIPTLSSCATAYSAIEIMHERVGEPYENTHTLDLILFSDITGQKITHEREKKILGYSEEEFLADQALLNTPL